ncbi:MAG TPA: AI-2E family transporter [Stellaceae bacterium]|nr:AI-2E family transporter [Stellaceae bacterium]
MNDIVFQRPAAAPSPGETPPPEQALAAAEPTRAHPPPSWAAIGIFLLLLLAGMAYAREFLMPVALAFLLALVFSPVRRFLNRRGLPSWLSTTLIVGALLAVVIAGILVLSGPVSDWINRAPSIFSDLQTKMRALRGVAATVAEVGNQVDNITKSPTAGPQAPEVVVRQPGIAASLAWIAPLFIAQIVFVLVLLFFLLSSGDMIYEKIVHVLPTLTDKKRAVRIARDIELKLSTYLFTITVINAGLGVATGVVMWAIGMPNPLLFGVGAFAFNYIPYAGAAAGVALATIVGLISGDGLWLGVVAGSSYLMLTTVEGQLITPYFVGRQLRLNTVVVFLSIALWAWLWSVVGMIVATPLLVAVRTFCEYIPSLEGVGSFLSARGEEQEETSAPSAT